MEKLMVSGDLNLEQLSQLRIIAEVNEHGYAFFSGIISMETSREILKTRIRDVTIYFESQTESGLVRTTLFSGRIQKYSLKKADDIFYIEVECLSVSVDFDEKKKSRSFQDTGMTFGQVFRQIAGTKRTIHVIKGGEEKLLYPFIQYEETDWEFLKRMAGYLKTVVIPDPCHLYPQISIGMVSRKTYDICNQSGFELERDIKLWRVQNGSKQMNQAFSLKIEGNLDMNLCDNISYKGFQLPVLRKEVWLLRGMLNCNCWIGMEGLKTIDMHFNKHLGGLRLRGSVEAVAGEKMKLRLDIDKETQKQELYPYAYLPITGNGMYAMPEIGSTAYLYFPDYNEKNAFVIDCLSSENAKRLNSDCRYLETEQKKTLEMQPGELGMKADDNQLKILDKYGIHFSSCKQIRVTAKRNLIICNAGITCLRSKEYLHMEHNKGSNDSIHMEGVECVVKTTQFLTSDIARKAEHADTHNPRMAWRAAETAKNMLPKAIGAIPSSSVGGIGGKVLGGIPGSGRSIMDVDISEVAGIGSERTN